MARYAISADSHINEDPDLWQERLPDALKPHGPRTIDLDNGGQGWWMEDITDEPIPLGLTAVVHRATKRYDRAHFKERFKEYKDGYKQGVRYEDILPGSFRADARLQEMDEDGVDAEVLYQSPLIWPAIKTSDDRDLVLACFRAYNDWMAEFNSHAPDRLLGPALVPSTGVADAIAELQRCVQELGMRSVTLESYPNGSLVQDQPEEDDRFWAAVSELGIPVNVHIAFTVPMNAAKLFATGGQKAVVAMEQGSFRNVITNLILNGTFDRFPDLQIVGAEVNCGWVPHYFERFDDRYQRYRRAEGYDLELLPSDYWRRHCYATYVGGLDYFGLQDRYEAGLDNLMWSSDFPHSVSNWPIDLEIGNDMLDCAGVTEPEREKLMWRNAAKVYRLERYLTSA
jgi:predicted TIM-barrel fold metal-dependent hydrolase